jgi:hypothetical protein
MPKSSELFRALLFAWIGLCLVVLALVLSTGRNPEEGIFFAYAMLALTFPIGFVAAYLEGVGNLLLERFFGYVVPYDPIANFATWVLFVAFGYLQWFVLLPRALGKYRHRRANSERVI